MKTCDEYQVDLERRRRGALPAEAAGEAERHLAGCAGCPAAEELAGRTDALLWASARAAAERVDWERMGRAIEREVRAWRALPWVLLGFFSLLGLGAGLAFSPERWSDAWLRISGIGVVFAAVSAIYGVRKLRAARRATASGGEELLVYRRRELDAQIREERRMWMAGPLMVVSSAVGAALAWGNAHHAGEGLLGIALLCAAATVHSLGFELPRLRRERAELS